MLPIAGSADVDRLEARSDGRLSGRWGCDPGVEPWIGSCSSMNSFGIALGW
jgi:hypothetical protein